MVWASRQPGRGLQQEIDRLSLYVTLKKHQMKLARGYGFIYDNGRIVALVFDNRVPAEDPELDKQVAEAGLKPSSNAARARGPLVKAKLEAAQRKKRSGKRRR